MEGGKMSKSLPVATEEKMWETLEKKYYDYNSFRDYLIKSMMENKSWKLTKSNPLNDWAVELVKETCHNFKYSDAYVDYGEVDLVIEYEGCGCCEDKILAHLWHECFLKSLNELGEYTANKISAKQAYKILEKVIELMKEIENQK
jgi:hypothetical protein